MLCALCSRTDILFLHPLAFLLEIHIWISRTLRIVELCKRVTVAEILFIFWELHFDSVSTGFLYFYLLSGLLS